MPELEICLMEFVEEAARDALEEMFFLVVFERVECATVDSDALAAELAFTGDACGTLRIALSSRAASEAAANFLGEDAGSLSDDQVRAVVCELTNILCGSALSRWRHHGSFSLGQPQSVPVPQEPLAPGGNCGLSLENGTMYVWLSSVDLTS